MSIVKHSNGIFPNSESHNFDGGLIGVATLRINFTMGLMWSFAKLPENVVFDDLWYQREDVARQCLHYIRRRTLQQVSIEPTCQNTQHPSQHSRDFSIDAIISINSLQAHIGIFFHFQKVTYPVFLFRWEHRLKIITHEEDEINEILGCDKQENLCF